MRSNKVKVKNPTASRTWKLFEQHVSNDFGAERMPGSGGIKTMNTRSDSQQGRLFIECKYRNHISVYSLYEDTAIKAKVEDKTPVVALKQKGSEGYLLLLKPEDLIKIANEYVGRKQHKQNKQQ